MSRPRALPVWVLLAGLVLAGCSSVNHPPIRTAAKVDLPRFMGAWYVIANIPTFIEKGAHNAIEHYALAPDGTIATTFTFNAGAFDGERKQYNPRGFVLDKSSNAVWGMQFIWPIKADYRIVFLDPEYRLTIVGRERRDYVWIMARTPQIPDADYQAMLEILRAEGYDIDRIQRVPQRWPEAQPPRG
jgi:apolipoprotein D and lipocalin family protein